VAIPGSYASLKGFTVPTTGQGRAVIGWFPSEEDTFNIFVYPDGTQAYPGFSENQMRVGFHKQVDSPKEMLIWSPEEQITRTLRLNKSSDPIRWQALTRPLPYWDHGGPVPPSTPEGPTLSFKKQSWGQWIDKYYLNKDEFWSVFKGKVVLFNWVTH